MNARLILAALLFLPSIAHGDSGDSDAFGYTVRSSTDGGSTYNYLSVATPTFLLLEDEDARIIQLPFGFPFYGTTWSSVDVHSNGALTFGAATVLPWDHDCGDLQVESTAIWGLYDDIDPTDVAVTVPVPGVYRSTHGTAPNRIFVVEWFQLPLFEVPGTITFQIQLHEADGRVEVHYSDTLTADGSRNNGRTAVAGISGGQEDLLFSCDAPDLPSEFALTYFPPCEDLDGDGFCPGPAPDPEDRDCDDTDPDVHPGAPELCNGEDDDCDGGVPDDEFDADGDGLTGCDGDCDDTDRDVLPGADERCNGVDDDCDGDLPDDEVDGDGDGVSPCDGDCDDDAPTVAPDAEELCNDADDDCDPNTPDPSDCDDLGEAGPAGVPYGCLLRCDTSRPDAGSAGLALLLMMCGLRRRARPCP